MEAYDEQGKHIRSAELDIYGRVKEFTGEKDFIPFRFQGQYEDIEIGLYYNRFRYYLPNEGLYTQQDPIRLAGDNSTLYAYVGDTTSWIDPLGLMLVNPKLINFAQRTINSAFDTPLGKRSVQSVVNDVKKGNVKVTDFPSISVVDVKGQLVARDGNSRLAIAKMAKAKEINVRIETDMDSLKDL